ncbi:hypothetical protein [Streptococcus loxodontisalivarius]|uniref:Uncharacterized protein n=1 Tax=Streptococcus loxodontisalivarius TaxID=1349415 RepID=A0ABS2PP49_9STRE|nr:hypothetical protein [Streptococcus loxodontisalivarius]MBM7641799.1 hypothetical protein [Streptococcus loxodontisalivarius]
MMTLLVNREELSIMGVTFDNLADFEAVWYAIGSSMIEDFQPKKQDVEYLKNYIMNKRK